MHWSVLCIKAHLLADKIEGVSKTSVAMSIGLSNAAPTGWKNGKEPNETTLLKLASYFGVSVEYLTGVETEKNTATDDGSGIGLRATNYDKLSDENKMLIDQMIEKLIESQSGD